jgi:carbon-monoxide dehydrogenase medium subunit
MYPRNFDYVRAGSVAEAIKLLHDGPDAKLIAGGHSLLPILKLRQLTVGTLIDIGRIDELRRVGAPNGTITLGALTTHAKLAANPILPEGLREAAANIGDWQVRNRGTVGGNIAHADPGSDHPTVLTALGAIFHVMGPKGERTITAADCFTGIFQTVLQKDEILTAVEIPTQKQGTGTAYAKMAHPASGYAMIGVMAVLTMNGDTCTEASVAIGGLTPKATKARSVEAALVGKKLDEAVISAAADAIADDLGSDLLGDIQADAGYRKAVAPVFVRRALAKAVERAK